MRIFYVIGYEELAVPYIKKCMEAGATKKSYEESVKLISLNPSSDLGLRYAINSSGLLGKYDVISIKELSRKNRKMKKL